MVIDETIKPNHVLEVKTRTTIRRFRFTIHRIIVKEESYMSEKQGNAIDKKPRVGVFVCR
nr:hypothetical protein [Candidatus Sigynarchaeota archaeon]